MLDTKILKVARIKKDLTIDEAAKKLNLNKNTYCNYEKGNYKNIKLITLKKMVEVLDVDPMELFNNVSDED